MNEKKLVQTKKGELNKILYSNNVSEDVFEMIHKIGKRAMNTKIICCPRRRVIISHKELRDEKENLKIEKQALMAEINLFRDLLKD